MYRHILFLLASVCLVACGNKHEEQQQQLRHEMRTQFYAEELQKARALLARTDSLLQRAEADADSLDVQQRIRLDSLKTAFDVQGAKVRYILRKQKELQ
ncbi:MAG: hypothetical protein IJ144_02705 [Prevotella sp.]|nr:hypothetical protein [Prevotella sp.]MBQ9186719.1 hypothetical protein [Prevotella sp.]